MEHEMKEMKETKAVQAKVIMLLETSTNLLETKLAKKEKELKMKDSENAQEFNDLFDDLKDKEEFVERLKKQRNGLQEVNSELKTNLEKKEEELKEHENTIDKQKRLLKDVMEKNHDYEKGVQKHEAKIEINTIKVVELQEELKIFKIQLETANQTIDSKAKENVKHEGIVKVLEEEKNNILRKFKDFEDEIQTKELEVNELKDLIEKENKASSLKNSASSLADELTSVKNNDDQTNRMNILEKKLIRLEKSKAKRMELFDKMDQISLNRSKQIEDLEHKINIWKPKAYPKCRYGKFCRRLFCKFDHHFLFVKKNCDKKQEEMENHPCTLCAKVFRNEKSLLKHKQKYHSEEDIECSNCGIFCVSKEELKNHMSEAHAKHAKIESNELVLNGVTRSHIQLRSEKKTSFNEGHAEDDVIVDHDHSDSSYSDSTETSIYESSESESGEASSD